MEQRDWIRTIFMKSHQNIKYLHLIFDSNSGYQPNANDIDYIIKIIQNAPNENNKKFAISLNGLYITNDIYQKLSKIIPKYKTKTFKHNLVLRDIQTCESAVRNSFKHNKKCIWNKIKYNINLILPFHIFNSIDIVSVFKQNEQYWNLINEFTQTSMTRVGAYLYSNILPMIKLYLNRRERIRVGLEQLSIKLNCNYDIKSKKMICLDGIDQLRKQILHCIEKYFDDPKQTQQIQLFTNPLGIRDIINLKCKLIETKQKICIICNRKGPHKIKKGAGKCKCKKYWYCCKTHQKKHWTKYKHREHCIKYKYNE